MVTLAPGVEELNAMEMRGTCGGLPILIIGVIVIASAAAAGVSVNYVIATN